MLFGTLLCIHPAVPAMYTPPTPSPHRVKNCREERLCWPFFFWWCTGHSFDLGVLLSPCVVPFLFFSPWFDTHQEEEVLFSERMPARIYLFAATRTRWRHQPVTNLGNELIAVRVSSSFFSHSRKRACHWEPVATTSPRRRRRHSVPVVCVVGNSNRQRNT